MRRAADGRASLNLVRLAAVMVVVVAFAGVAAHAGQNGAGMWVYSSDWSTSIVNLTNYTLRILWPMAYVVDSDGCYAGDGQATDEWLPFLLSNPNNPDAYAVGPYQTWQMGIQFGCNGDPYSYEGYITFNFDGFPLEDSTFRVVFRRQGAAGVVGDKEGTWIALSPISSSQGWYPAGSVDNGNRFATAVDDNVMHNYMNLINDKVMVALYTPNNNHIVLVVQQYVEQSDGWNDDMLYHELPLDWVDNPGSSVPGQ